MLKKWSYLVIILAVTLVGCSEYQKVLKSTDLDYKYEKAIEYYEEDDYFKALPLFEELIPLYRGSERAEIVYYYYCYCNYEQDMYSVAAFHFKKFARTFPTSKHAEETLFMSGYCYFLLSPKATLDQSDTYRALDAMQLFINTYPENTLVDSSNTIMDRLRAKLETKSYMNSKQYFKLQDYKAAIIALNNTLKDYPETERREELLFLIYKSNYLLSINSVEKKKLSRIEDTIEAYYTFVDSYAESEYMKEAEQLYKKIIEEKNKLALENL